MDEDHRSTAPGHAGFEATRWSVVLEAARSRAPGGPEALARLCERYWPPLYAFARHRGHGPEDPQDLVQGFFEHLIKSRALGAVDQAKGRFRSFLLASFQNFISMERRRARTERRGGRAELVRIDWLDAEGRIGFEPEEWLTPETLYDARWALELLGRATRAPGTGAGRPGQSRSLPYPAALPGRRRRPGGPDLRRRLGVDPESLGSAGGSHGTAQEKGSVLPGAGQQEQSGSLLLDLGAAGARTA
jgi:DNA-directed RNA polymerase specialized sigma24 family protein